MAFGRQVDVSQTPGFIPKVNLYPHKDALERNEKKKEIRKSKL